MENKLNNPNEQDVKTLLKNGFIFSRHKKSLKYSWRYEKISGVVSSAYYDTIPEVVSNAKAVWTKSLEYNQTNNDPVILAFRELSGANN